MTNTITNRKSIKIIKTKGIKNNKNPNTRKIYGVSSKYSYGWHYKVYVFDSKTKAEEWLNTEEYDFRDRELMTKTSAIKLVGRKAVDNATEMYGAL